MLTLRISVLCHVFIHQTSVFTKNPVFEMLQD